MEGVAQPDSVQGKAEEAALTAQAASVNFQQTRVHQNAVQCNPGDPSVPIGPKVYRSPTLGYLDPQGTMIHITRIPNKCPKVLETPISTRAAASKCGGTVTLRVQSRKLKGTHGFHSRVWVDTL